MKHSLLSIFAILISAQLYAQNSSGSKRMIAETRFEHDQSSTDSVSYSYNALRKDYYTFNTTTLLYNRGLLSFPQHKLLVYDTSVRYLILPSGTEFHEKNIKTYNIDGRVAGEFFLSNILDTGRTTYTYNTAGNITESINEKYIDGLWVNTGRSINTYDINDKLVSIVSMYWNTGFGPGFWMVNYQTTYTYSVNNMTGYLVEVWDYTAQGWLKDSRVTYTFPVAGSDPAAKLIEWWNGTSWTESESHVYTYSSNGDLLIDSMSYDNTGTIEPYEKTFFTFNADHKLIESLTQAWVTSWKDWNKKTCTYGADSFLYRVEEKEWSGASNSWADKRTYKYYYEDVPVIAAVNEVSINSVIPVIYPNPTSGHLNIKADWGKAQTCTGAIYDMQGRLVMSWNEPVAAKEYDRMLDVSALPAGNYKLVLSGSSTKASANFAVVK